MPSKRKKRLDSDDDYKAPPAPKRPRHEVEEDIFFQTSSAPTSPHLGPSPSPQGSEDEEDEGRPRAVSETPAQIPSPATSTIFESPVKARGGRPRVRTHQRHSRAHKNNLTSEQREEIKSSALARTKKRTAENRKKKAAVLAEEKRKKEAEEEARRRQEEEESAARRRAKVFSFLDDIMLPEDEGGAGFTSAMDLFRTIMSPGGDSQASANLTRFLKSHGKEIIEAIIERVPAVGQEYLDQKFDEKLEKVLQMEGQAIQDFLTRGRMTSIMHLEINSSLEGVAPTLWRILDTVATPGLLTRREKQGEARREKRLVFTTACAMLSVSRSQLANNYQLVIGLFLLASGASKREMEVLAHAGLSTSYDTIQDHIHILSAEAVKRFQQLIKKQMCFIVWDNLNIAFRVESQRLNSANHFDNGTTGTLLPVYNPFTGSTTTPLGSLPLSMKPPRTTTFPVIDWEVHDVLPSPESAEQLSRCCLWQLKRLAMEHIQSLQHLKEELEDCPEVDQIAIHQTDQYPVPAMHEEESSLEGSIRVYTTILGNLKVTEEDLKAHGLRFNDGDLLTDSLVDKIESARRNSDEVIDGMKAVVRRFGLFHAKMAGCRLVINEHWGQPNSLWPGSLWWEHNKLLNRKPISAGWKAKKATPWKPCHELLQISLAAHVKDGFRIHCGHTDLDAWAASASIADFNAVAERVYRKLFTTEALDDLRSMPQRDISHENVLLFNRDALFYIEFVAAIKKGDIGRVINVLQVWMVMMRSSKTMPKYADAIFETLRRIDRYDPVLKCFFLHNWLVNLTGRPYGFKEVDLLQEHQNFWAKIIYNAKGSNKSWKWLSMITVCIFTLRDTMRTVQKTFKITRYGERHTMPDMTKEAQVIADALRDERLQEYVANRPANDPTDSTAVTPVRDLLEEGSKYPDTRGAFKKFTKEEKRAENLGEDVGMDDDYDVTAEDLGVDDEEAYTDADAMMAAATELVSHYM
ncbi:hypothetical protein MVEN_00284700 [Mycena venus]|uniref:DUF6589 domain-containing protein n=1 Tax=Mycena venus TaxID=2733690 RepID=A0A8H6YZU1_9AGAR|nr:hypothetical protein MVEN_00284700 [Mycena venus]